MIGIFSDLKCDYCENPLNSQQKVFVFKCKHIMHNKCCDGKIECRICSENESEKGTK